MLLRNPQKTRTLGTHGQSVLREGEAGVNVLSMTAGDEQQVSGVMSATVLSPDD